MMTIEERAEEIYEEYKAKEFSGELRNDKALGRALKVVIKELIHIRLLLYSKMVHQ